MINRRIFFAFGCVCEFGRTQTTRTHLIREADRGVENIIIIINTMKVSIENHVAKK